jgi:hypothetical protein
MARLPVHLPRALVVVHPALTRRKEAPVQAMAVLGGEDALGFLVVEPGEPRRQVVEAEVLVEAVEPGGPAVRTAQEGFEVVAGRLEAFLAG